MEEKILDEFVKFVAEKLRMDELPKVEIQNDKDFAKDHKTFGIYMPDQNATVVETYGRNIVDVMRTIAHELTHHRQNEVNSNKSRADLELEAHAAAGMLVKLFCANHPELYGTKGM
jgi:hypothetical protein